MYHNLAENAKYINLEIVNSKELDRYVLRNWSYYMLQGYIEYKAAMHGITVRYVKANGADEDDDVESARRIAETTEFVTKRAIEKEQEKEKGLAD